MPPPCLLTSLIGQASAAPTRLAGLILVTAGGTLKSAGHVYVDTQGNEYFVPDIEVVIELSENVAAGVITFDRPRQCHAPRFIRHWRSAACL